MDLHVLESFWLPSRQLVVEVDIIAPNAPRDGGQKHKCGPILPPPLDQRVAGPDGGDLEGRFGGEELVNAAEMLDVGVLHPLLG
eukprot:6179124-Pyramimonas_sp.AAC.1